MTPWPRTGKRTTVFEMRMHACTINFLTTFEQKDSWSIRSVLLRHSLRGVDRSGLSLVDTIQTSKSNFLKNQFQSTREIFTATSYMDEFAMFTTQVDCIGSLENCFSGPKVCQIMRDLLYMGTVLVETKVYLQGYLAHTKPPPPRTLQ
jgi:hypothetical protein